MTRALFALACACLITATARAADPVAPATPVPALRPVSLALPVAARAPEAPRQDRTRLPRFTRGRLAARPVTALPVRRLELPTTDGAATVRPTLPATAPQETVGTSRFTVNDEQLPDGTLTEVTLDGEALLVPFVTSLREAPAANAQAGGRLLTGTAGLALRTGTHWESRMQVSRQTAHSLGGETLAQRYSVSLVRRF